MGKAKAVHIQGLGTNNKTYEGPQGPRLGPCSGTRAAWIQDFLRDEANQYSGGCGG